MIDNAESGIKINRNIINWSEIQEMDTLRNRTRVERKASTTAMTIAPSIHPNRFLPNADPTDTYRFRNNIMDPIKTRVAILPRTMKTSLRARDGSAMLNASKNNKPTRLSIKFVNN